MEVESGGDIALPLNSGYWVAESGSLGGHYVWADRGGTWNNNSSYDVSSVNAPQFAVTSSYQSFTAGADIGMVPLTQATGGNGTLTYRLTVTDAVSVTETMDVNISVTPAKAPTLLGAGRDRLHLEWDMPKNLGRLVQVLAPEWGFNFQRDQNNGKGAWHGPLTVPRPPAPSGTPWST